MFNQIPPYLAPEQEPFLPRDADIDLEDMPPGQGDLNFRPPLVLPANQAFWTVSDLLLAGFFAVPCGLLSRDVFGQYLLNEYLFLALMLVAGLSGLVQLLRPRGENSTESRMLAWYIIPLLLWATLALPALATTWTGALAYVVLLPLTITILMADQVATHGVWWMTANPRLDLATLLAWRKDWQQRYSGPPDRPPRLNQLDQNVQELHQAVQHAKQDYRRGPFLVAVCLGTGVTFTWTFPSATKPFEQGLAFFLGFVFALILAGLYRTRCFPRAFRICWTFLLVWLSGQQQRDVPWSLQSPSIPAFYRGRLFVLCMFQWAIGLSLATDQFAWLCFLDPNPGLRPIIGTPLLPPRGDWVFLSITPQNTFSVLYIVLAVLACMIAPVLVFIAVFFVLAGAVLAAHFFALEVADAYEQR
jgi:hypothetical protein